MLTNVLIEWQVKVMSDIKNKCHLRCFLVFYFRLCPFHKRFNITNLFLQQIQYYQHPHNTPIPIYSSDKSYTQLHIWATVSPVISYLSPRSEAGTFAFQFEPLKRAAVRLSRQNRPLPSPAMNLWMSNAAKYAVEMR